MKSRAQLVLLLLSLATAAVLPVYWWRESAVIAAGRQHGAEPAEIARLERDRARILLFAAEALALVLALGLLVRVLRAPRDRRARQQAEAALRERDVQLRSIGDNFPEGAPYQLVVSTDGTARFTHVGPGFEEIFGVPPTELLADATWMERRVLPEDLPVMADAGVQSRIDLTPFRQEVRIRASGDAVKWISFRSQPRRLACGDTVWDGVMLDVTRYKQAQQSIAQQVDFYAALNTTTLELLERRAQAALLQAIVERTASLLDVPHVELALLEGDALVTRAYAGPEPDVLGDRATRDTAMLSWRAVDTRRPVMVEDYPSISGARAEYSARGARAAAVFPILHGRECLGVLGLVRNRAGHTFNLDDLQKGQLLAQIVALVLHNASIYEQAVRETEQRTQALRESEERFHAVFEQSPIAILLMTFPEGRIVEVNSAAMRAFGGTREEAVGRTALDEAGWVEPAERLRYLERLCKDRHVAAYETRMRRRDGEIFHVLMSSTLVEIAGRTYSLNSLEDITTLRQAEARLQQTQKIESLGTLAGGIAHDFNNILTGLLGLTELARLELPPDHPARPRLDGITAAGERARHLVQQILTFSRRSESERVPMDLAPVVREAFRLMRSTIPTMVDLSLHCAPDCPRVEADVTQIHQVLVNLCTNAWHALPPNRGHIRISLEAAPVPPALRAATDFPPDPVLRLTVADDGCGIPAHVLPRIFDPFFTTKPAGKGTGLGLAVVDGIVRAHRGAINVHSSPASGTTIEIYLPALTAEAAGAAPPASAADDSHPPRGNGEPILLVDDDLHAREAMESALRHLNYNVETSPDAATALLRLSARNFAALVTDYAMPGMTGVQLLQRARQIRPELPTILVSGYLEPDALRQAIAAGAREVLSKPPSYADLARAVARCVNPDS